MRGCKDKSIKIFLNHADEIKDHWRLWVFRGYTLVPPFKILWILSAKGTSLFTKVILTTGYNNLPFWFLIVLGTIIDPSPSINPAK